MAKILVVDDDSTNRQLIVTLLGYGGHRLLEASEGFEALEILRREKPDLVITDILMPRMDGFEFVRRVRAESDIAVTRIVFCSASFLEGEARALAHRCGVRIILRKPLEPEAVLEAARSELGVILTADPLPVSEDFHAQHLGLITDKLVQKVKELETLNNELERRVVDRTERLRELNQQLESFAYSVSHDLRGPLTSMAGFARLLEREHSAELSDTARDYVRRILAASVRMNEMTEGLLHYSRVAREEVRPRRVDVGQLIDGVIGELEAVLRERGAEVRIDRPLPVVRANSVVLGQVLANLVGNAVKFVAPGTRPDVRVRAERNDGMVRVWVEDNGIGIAPEDRERIFEVFARTQQAKEYPGTGCGLAIVRAGVQRMGGRLGVESTPGKGSRFWIELPEHTDESPEQTAS